jgi:glycosyltransferase involved in cell wall biosynthesis
LAKGAEVLDEPLVSVIIPTFNRKQLVERAIASVLNQTYANLELLVIDDGSTDGTGEALAHFRSDPRFHYAYQHNSGQSAARNSAISVASGNLIALLDSDNYWQADKLRRQLDFWAGKPGHDILYSLGYLIDLEGNILNSSAKLPRPSGNILNQLLQGNCITNNTVLVSRKCFQELGGFDESLRIAEDYDLWLRFATRYTFLHHPERVVYYCVEGERLSAREEQNIQVNIQILKRFFQLYPGLVSHRRQKMALGNLLVWQIESRWNRGIKPAFKDVASSLLSNLFDMRCWRHLLKFVIK